MAVQGMDAIFADSGFGAALVAALPAAILVEDEHRRIVLANERLCGLFRLNRSPAELIGSDAGTLTCEMRTLTADARRFASRADDIVDADEPAVDEAIEFADGSFCDRDYAPILVGGERRGRVWMYRDVAPPRAPAPRRSGTDYIALLSHEIRTPLTAIKSFVGLLRENQPPLPAEAAEFAEIIERNTDRLLRLVSDLLFVTHAETGTLRLQPVPVSVPEVVAEAVRASSESAAQRGVTLEFSAAGPARGPLVTADRQSLLLVLDNLLSNAIKFSAERARVTVTTRFDGARWRIDVTDWGIGIPRGEQDQVFDPFFRGSNARIAQIPGTGLGLSVARAITGLQRGRVEVRTVPDGSTTATVCLRPCP